MSDQPSDSQPSSDTRPADEHEPRGIRWWPAVAIGVFSIGVTTYAQIRYADEVTWREPYTFVGGLLIPGFLLCVWWLFFSRARWTTKVKVALVPIVIVACLLGCFRFTGFSGSVWPQWEPRFRPGSSDSFPWIATYVPSAEEQLQAFVAEARDDGTAVPVKDEDVANWSGFRGPERDGIVRGVEIRTDWNENPPEKLWGHSVGEAWSSFAVIDGLAYTQEQRGEDEAVVCYDATTGEQIWEHRDEARFSEPQRGPGPACTPTLYDGRLYTLGGTGLLNCLDPLTGTVRWSTNILEDANSKNIVWGMCASPLVYDDVVVVNPGVNFGEGDYAVAAYDRLTGERKWTAGDTQASYCAPRLETIDGQRQVLIFDAAGLGGYHAEYGTELWRFPWQTFSDINVAQPIVSGDDHVFIASGYSGSYKNGCTLLKVARDDAGEWSVRQEYERPTKFKMKFQSAVFDGGYLYGLDDGILACHDYETGDRVWKDRDGTYGFGQILLVDGHILTTIEKTGEVALVKASPDGFEEVGRFQALGADRGKAGITWNHPVVWNSLLFVRNGTEAACYDLRPE